MTAPLGSAVAEPNLKERAKKREKKRGKHKIRAGKKTLGSLVVVKQQLQRVGGGEWLREGKKEK